MKSGPVAIIGAGISGLSCAHALRAANVEARLFERGVRVGGRCATLLWQGHLVDYGIPYFTAQSAEFKRELLMRLRQFRPIVGSVLNQEDMVVNCASGPRFYVLQGNNYLAQVLSQRLDIQLDTTVETVSFGSAGIDCQGETFRALVSSLPGSQSAHLFSLTQEPVEYAYSLIALLEYAGTEAGQSGECYGRLVPEGKGALVASYCENHKAGRIIGNKTVFVVQASSRFSEAHADAPQEVYLPELIRAHEELWRIPAGKCTASFGHRWKLCRRAENSDAPLRLPPGAFVCGDSRTAEATIEDVWMDGQRAAADVLAYLAA
jgi:renalase